MIFRPRLNRPSPLMKLLVIPLGCHVGFAGMIPSGYQLAKNDNQVAGYKLQKALHSHLTWLANYATKSLVNRS